MTDPILDDTPRPDVQRRADPDGLRPPGQHNIVDPADVSEAPILSPNADEVPDAEAELLVSEAASAPPIWASSRLIAALVALVVIAIIVGIGIWLGNWLLGPGGDVLAPL